MIRRMISEISYRIDRGCRWGALVFLSTMVVLVLFQVLARYIFRAVPMWTEEVARYCMVWGGLLGATIAFRAERDPKLLPSPKKGPRLWISTAGFLRNLAVLVFLGPVLYHSDRYLSRHWQRSMAGLDIPTTWVSVAVPVAIAVIFIHLIAKVIGEVPEKNENGQPPRTLTPQDKNKQ